MHMAPAPLWDSSSARDAESNSAKSTSNTRLSTAAPALRCHPRLTFGDGSSSPAKGPASAVRDGQIREGSHEVGEGAGVAFPQGADHVRPGCPVRCMTVLPCGG